MNQRRTPFRGAVDQLTRDLVEAILVAIRSTPLPELAAAFPSQPSSKSQPRRAVAPKARGARKARAPSAAPRKKREAPTWARSVEEESPEWAGTTVITDPMALLKGAVTEADESPRPTARAEAPAEAAPVEPEAPPPPPSRRTDATPAVRQGEDILRTGTGVMVLRRGGRRASQQAH